MISRFDIVVESCQVSEEGDLQLKLVPKHLLGAEVLDEDVELGEGEPSTASEGGGTNARRRWFGREILGGSTGRPARQDGRRWRRSLRG